MHHLWTESEAQSLSSTIFGLSLKRSPNPLDAFCITFGLSLEHSPNPLEAYHTIVGRSLKHGSDPPDACITLG